MQIRTVQSQTAILHLPDVSQEPQWSLSRGPLCTRHAHRDDHKAMTSMAELSLCLEDWLKDGSLRVISIDYQAELITTAALSKWSMKLRLIHEQNAVRQVRVWETEVDHTLKQFINLAKEFHFPIDAIDHLESATCCAAQFNLKTQGLLSPRSLP